MATAGETPLRIPFGNKKAALALGARYRGGGWYAPPGVDPSGFRERGWVRRGGKGVGPAMCH